MQKLKMCTNLFLWSICLFLIIFLYYCPGHTIGHDNHRLNPGNNADGRSGVHHGFDVHSLDDHFIPSEEKCPCITRDQCPRVYGETATDVKELGFLKPCKEFGTVRCCGVTVSIRIEHDKDEDRDDVFDKLKHSSSKTADGINGGHIENHNMTGMAASSPSISSTIDSKANHPESFDGGIHSNYLWDREEDLDVAESNQSNIESGTTTLNDDDGSKTSPGVTSLRPNMRLRPRRKLLQRANAAGNVSRSANLKDKIVELNVRAAAANTSEDSDKNIANKEPDMTTTKSELENIHGPTPASSPAAGTQEMSKLSKLRVVRPGGPKLRRLNQQSQVLEKQDDGSGPQVKVSGLSISSPPAQEVGGVVGGPPRMKKRILRRKKINSFSPTSTETESTISATSGIKEVDSVGTVNSEGDGPVPAFSLPPKGHSEGSPIFEQETKLEEPAPTLSSSTSTDQSNISKFIPNLRPHAVLIKRKPQHVGDSANLDTTSNNRNSFNVDSHADEAVPPQQQFKPTTPFKFPKFQRNTVAAKSDSKAETAEKQEEENGDHESDIKETQPHTSRTSSIGMMKPLRKRLRPIRPAAERVGPGQDASPKVSILTPTDNKSGSESSPISPSYTSTSSSSSRYPNPIRKLQKLRKRVRPVLPPSSKPEAPATTEPHPNSEEYEASTPVTAAAYTPNSDNTENEDDVEEAIKIETSTTPKYKFSSSVSYTESKRKDETPKASYSKTHSLTQHVKSHDRNVAGTGSQHHAAISSTQTRTNAGEGQGVKYAEETTAQEIATSITAPSEGSDIALTSTAGKIENEFASPVASLPKPDHNIPQYSAIETAPRPAQPSTHIYQSHNRQSVKLRTHSKDDDEGEEGKYNVAEEKVISRERVHGISKHRQIGRPRQTQEHVSNANDANVEPKTSTPIQVTSTYSNIRVGNVRHRGNRPELEDEEDAQVDVHFQNNNLMTPAPQEQDQFVAINSGTSSSSSSAAKKKGGSRRFSIPTKFDIEGAEEFRSVPKPTHHHRTEETEESYDVILDKDIRHNLRKPARSRLTPTTQEVSQEEETRTLEFVNRHPLAPTPAPVTEPKRMRIRRPPPPATTGSNEETASGNYNKRKHAKIAHGEVVHRQVEVHTDLVPTEKQSNYEHIKSTTAFPAYKPRSTIAPPTQSPITSGYSGSANSKSNGRRVEKPSLLLEAERSKPDAEEEEEYGQNTNLPTDASRIGSSQYNQHYSYEYEQPQTYVTTTTTTRPSTTTAPYVYHHHTNKNTEHQQNTKGISNYYFNEVSTTPAYYIHTSPLPSETEGEELESSRPKFVFPPYRFEITAKPTTGNDEQQKNSKHVAAPEIIYSATVPPPTTSPRSRYVSPVSTEAYYHQIAPTESSYSGPHYSPSTTPMPLFPYFTSTGAPTKEDDGLYHRHHHLHYFANNDNMGLSTPKPTLSTVSFASGFTPIRSNNSTSTRFHAPEIFDLPSHLDSNTAYSYETTSSAPEKPQSAFSYSGFPAYNSEMKPPRSPQHETMMRFPGHVEIGGTKRPVSVQVKVAGLNGQTQHQQQHAQHMQVTGVSSKPQLQTLIDIQNPRETTSDYIKYQSHHEESPHSTRTEPVNNELSSSNPDGLPNQVAPPLPMQQLYQYFGKDKETDGLGKFGTHLQPPNFGAAAVPFDEASFKKHEPSVIQIQHHYNALSIPNSYDQSPQLFNQMSPQTHDSLNALRNQMQTNINITNPFANTQQGQQQNYLGLASTPAPPLFNSAFDNAFKANTFQQNTAHNEQNFKEQLHVQLNADSNTGNKNQNPWSSSGTSQQQPPMMTTFSHGANPAAQTSFADGSTGQQMFRNNFNKGFPQQPQQQQQQQQQQPLIQFNQHQQPLTNPAQPSLTWKFPTSEGQPQQQNLQSPLQIPDVQPGQYNHQKHTLQYQTQDYTGGSSSSGGVPNGPPPLNPQLPSLPQQQRQAVNNGMMTGIMNRPNSNPIIQFGTAAVGANDGQMKGQNMNSPFNQQQQQRPNNVNLPSNLIRIQQQQQQGVGQLRKNVPHYIKEYHQHHSISQEILSQLKNSNRFNPFTGNARTSRATNLDDIEIIKASQDAVVATAAGNDEKVSSARDIAANMERTAAAAAAQVPDLTAEEKKDILHNVNFVVVGKQQEIEAAADEGIEKETAFTQPEVVSYFSLPETGRSLDSGLGSDSEPDTIKLTQERSSSESDDEDSEDDEDGTFSEPRTIQRGFLPIVPYSETDPGPLLVNVKDFNGADGRSLSRTSKALEDASPPPPRVVVTLTDDAGTPRSGPQT